MQETWKTYKLGEIVDNIFSGGTPNTTISDYWDGDYSWLSSGETRNRYIVKTEKKITEKGIKESSTRLGLQNDIVIASAGQGFTRGQTSYLLIDTYINQSLLAVRSNPDIVSSKFLFFNLSNRYFELRNLSDDNSSRGSLTTKLLKILEVSLPSLQTQNKIAEILSSLDDKIELNNQMNQTLEEMAQAIFKEWFVDFRFPGFDGELVDGLPKGWRLGNLTDLVETVSKTFKFSEHQNVIFLNTSDILDGEFLNSTLVSSKGLPGQAKKTILKGDILFSEIRPANKRYAYVNFDSEDYVVSTKLMVLRSKGIFDNIIIYYILKSSDVLKELQSLAESRSGTFPQITYAELSKISVNIPTKEVIDKFTVILQNVHEKISQNVIEIRTLTDLRDSLLPKLMNGKIKTNQ